MKELVGMFAAFMESSHPEEVLDCCVVGTVEAEDPKEVLGTLRETLLDALLDTDEGREQTFVDLGYHYYQSGAPVVNLIAILNFFHQGFIRTLSDVGMLSRYYARINDFFNDLKNYTTKGYLHKDLDELEFVFMSEFKNRHDLSPHMKWVQAVAQAIRGDDEALLPPVEEMKLELDRWLARPETAVLLGDEQDWVKLLHLSIEQLAASLARDFRNRNYLQMFILAKEIGKKTLYFLHTLNELYLAYVQNREKRFIDYMFAAMKNNRLSHVMIVHTKNLGAMTRIWGDEVGLTIRQEVQQLLNNFIPVLSRSGFFVDDENGKVFIFVTDRHEASIAGPSRKLLKKLDNIAIELEGNTIAFTFSLGVVEFKAGESYSRDMLQKLIAFVSTKSDFSEDNLYYLGTDEKQSVIEGIVKSYKQIQFIQNTLNEKNIQLFFQPVVEMETRDVYNLEALARIVTPDEIISAKEFIQTVYDLGMILKLDSLVFERIRDYQDQIRSVTDKIFLNVSPFSLKSASFRNVLKNTVNELKRVGLSLTIELTEQAVLENVDVIRFINEHYGVKFAIDDFGTGYSSLYTVASLSQSGAVEYLKVDGEMIRGMEHSPETFKVVNTIVNMSYALRLKTIPEYVENEAIANRLMKMGVKIAQGNYFCPASHIDNLCTEH